MDRRRTNAFFRETPSADVAAGSGRCVSYVLSDTSVGRDNHVIAADAWQLDNFLRNPVMPWAHDTEQPPIAKWVDVGTRGSRLVGTAEYADRDTYPFADTIFRLVKGGFLNAVSTGWLPIEWQYSTDRSRPGGIDFSKVELIEVSQVPVPALASALATARSKGINTAPLYDWCGRALDTHRSSIPRTELEILRREAKMPLAPKRTAQAMTIRGKFRSFAENLRAIVKAASHGEIDDRLERAPSGLSTEDVTAGAFLIQTDFSQQLVKLAYEASVVANLCDRRQTDNALAEVKVPGIDETSRADGSRWGGVVGYWPREGTTVAAVFPKFKMIEFSGNKVMVLVNGTNELMKDAPMFEAHIRRVVGDEFGFQLDAKILAGSGAGVPLGILNSNALITVPKADGQAAATIVAENISAMWKRLPAPSRTRAVWIVNEDADEQLDQLNSGNPNMYLPAGFNGNEYPLLKGRPLICAEQASQLGTPGDIMLADLQHYVVVDGGVKPMISLDVSFINDQAVLRFSWHVDGKPTFATPITPYNGSSTRSPLIALGAR